MASNISITCILLASIFCLVSPHGMFNVFQQRDSTAFTKELDRKLLQTDNQNDAITITVSSADELIESLEDINGTIAIIKIAQNSNIELIEALSITTNDTTIEGELTDGNLKPIITCKDDNGHILISGNNTKISNLEIKNCTGGPVIRIESNDLGEEDASTKFIKLSNLDFKSNSEIGNNYGDYKGGALFIGQGNDVTITDSTFEDNFAEQGAGIYWEIGSNLTIKDSEFENNIAEIAGGAIFTDPVSDKWSSLFIKNCTFSKNQYTLTYGSTEQGCVDKSGTPIEAVQVYDAYSLLCPTKGGGALFLESVNEVIIKKSNFEDNSGLNAAGAIFLNNVIYTEIHDCTFLSNGLKSIGANEISHGGAIYVLNEDSSSNFHLKHSYFDNNIAVHGGAIHFLAAKSKTYEIKDTDFIDNTAISSGGAIVLRNLDIELSGNRYIGNRAYTGGAIILTNDAVSYFGVTFSNQVVFTSIRVYNSFDGNFAGEGGAIAAIGSGNVQMTDTEMTNNAAAGPGGAIYIVETSISGLFELLNVTFDSNVALKGGAVYIQSVTNVQIEGNSKFIYNSALSGGAIYISVMHSYKDIIKIVDTTFESNKVKMSIDNLIFPDGVSEYLDMLVLPITENTDALLNKYGEDPCFPGGGGALCLHIYDTRDGEVLNVELSDLTFLDNSGYVGGAAMLVTRNELTENCENEGCYYIYISNSEFYGNEASGAGGAIFTFSPIFIQDSGTENDLVGKNLSLKFENNTVVNGGYGRDIASGIASLKLEEDDTGPLTGINSNIDEINIKIGVYDYYDQHIVKAIQNAEQVINARSFVEGNVSGLSGTMDVQAIKGVSSFTLKYDGEPGGYPLEFIDDENNISYFVDIGIRDCYIGEARIKATECLLCPEDFFSFDPQLGHCSACPRYAVCENGSHFLMPMNTYWHSSPLSPLMHRCLFKEACDFPNRISILTEIKNATLNVTNIDLTDFSEYMQAECNEGYRGMLCASCKEGYAHKVNGECIRCEKGNVSAFVIFLYFLWTFLLLSATVRSALTTVRDINILDDLAAHKKFKKHKSKSTGNDSFDSLTHRPSAASSELTFKEIEDLTVVVDCTKITPIKENEVYTCEIEESATSEPKTKNKRPPSIEVFSDHSSKLSDKRIIKAKIDKIFAAEKLSEMLKIFINFSKVTSVAIFVNIKWTETLERVLLLQNSMMGFTGSSSMSPIECYLSDKPQDSVFYGIIFRIFYPIIISAFLMSIFFIFWIFMRIRAKMHLPHLIRKITVVAVVTLFFSYDSVTSYLLRTVNCIKIDTADYYYDNNSNSSPKDFEYFLKFSNANKTYWAEDPDFFCYEGKHAVLVYSLGILGIILFSIGVPLGLTITLVYLKYKNKLQDKDIINRIGFVYQGYTEQFAYWEIIIIIRKALVQVVMVFAYPLQENLQCVLLLGIMIVAIVLQIIAWPFDYLILNLSETASLLISIMTFYFGLIFNDSKTSDLITIVLSFLLIFAIISLYTVSIVNIVNNLMTAYIQIEGLDVPDNFFKKFGLFSNVILLRNQKISKFAAIIKSNLSPKPQNIPMGNNNGNPNTSIQMISVN